MSAVASRPDEVHAVLVKAQAGPGGVALARRPLRPLGPDDVRVRIHRAAICGTDLHIIGWNEWAAQRYRPPFALGHEFSGIVEACGPRVRGISPGDKVAAETHLACGRCSQCKADRGHTCLNLRVFTQMDCGAFAQYAVVPAPLLRVLPNDLPHRHACLMEPLGIGLRAVREAGAGAGPLLVVGCGPIGLLAIASAKATGVSQVAAMDLSPERLALASAAGADILLDARDAQALPRAPALTAEGGVAAAIDTSGSTAGIATALAAIRPGGTLVLAGLPEGPVALDLTRHVILREITVRGIYGRHLRETWQDAIALMPALRPALDLIVTHAYPLAQFDEAIAVAASGKAGKVQFLIVEEEA